MLMSVICIILNAAYLVVLNLNIYTDRAAMPDGGFREWRRSPAARLGIADRSFLMYLQIALAAVAVISSVLALLGVRSGTVKTVRLISMIASTVTFIIIMIVTANTNARYA